MTKKEIMISIHASAKEATCKDIKAGLISHISIHASAKEATRPRIGFEKLSAISIHASAKEATRGGWLHNLQCRFQSTPPRRRRRTVDIVVDIVDNHFNPRLREGGDFSSLSSVDGETISIHASAKEAT